MKLGRCGIFVHSEVAPSMVAMGIEGFMASIKFILFSAFLHTHKH